MTKCVEHFTSKRLPPFFSFTTDTFVSLEIMDVSERETDRQYILLYLIGRLLNFRHGGRESRRVPVSGFRMPLASASHVFENGDKLLLVTFVTCRPPTSKVIPSSSLGFCSSS